MADEALNQEATPTEGAEPAEQPAAQEGVEKTPEQLDAEKAEAQKKEKEAEEAEEAAIRKKPWFQRRIDEVVKQRHEAERRAERLEQMLQRVIDQAQAGRYTGQPGQQNETSSQPVADFQPTRPAPTREQYEFDEEKYLNAVVDWRIEQREAKTDHERRVAEQRQMQKQLQETVEERRVRTMQEGAQKYPDFDDVIRSIPGTVMNPEMALCVLETGMPAEIAYHLGKNPAEAARISKLPPLKKAIELGKIETKITAAAQPTTKAPPPPNPIGGREPASKSESNMSMDEWLKARKAGKITGKN